MQKRSDLSKARSTKSVNPQQLLRGIFFIPLGVSLHFHPKKALLILENLLIGYDLLRENFGEEGEMDKIPKLEVSCLNP